MSIQTIITKAQQLLLIVIVFGASVAAYSQTISGERIVAASGSKEGGSRTAINRIIITAASCSGLPENRRCVFFQVA